MHEIVKAFLISALLLTDMATARAGVVISGTRFIFPEGEKSITFTVRNPSNTSWLIYPKISRGGIWAGANEPEKEQREFIASPQLFTLRPERENSVRLLYTGGALPQDRETLFTLSVASIPSGKNATHSVQTAIRSRFKLFYRPKNLPGNPEEAGQALRWAPTKTGVSVENPTPYYVTLFNLKMNGIEIPEGGIVAPFSKRDIPGCLGAKSCLIGWQSINDYGRIMPARSQLFEVTP